MAANFIYVPIYPMHFRYGWGKNGTLKLDQYEKKTSLIYLENDIIH